MSTPERATTISTSVTMLMATNVDCGEGNDEVHYDGPTQFSLGDLVTNCER